MQTFLPYDDFNRTARCLDTKRLGKQRVECLQIYKSLTISTYRWKQHPAVKMWAGYEFCLLAYALVICEEWIARGYKDTVLKQIQAEYIQQVIGNDHMLVPKWFGLAEFHDSHKSALLFKNPTHYGVFNWNVEPKLQYYWPPQEREYACR